MNRSLPRFPRLRPVLLAALLAGLATPAGLFAAMTPAALEQRLNRGDRVLLVDLRPAVAYEEGHIPGAINIPASLLPHKTLPTSVPVILYGDGLGLLDEAAALATVSGRPGLDADILIGGYAGWLTQTRLSTTTVGVRRERLPGITYQQLVTAAKDDMVIVDLRDLAPAAAPAGEGGVPSLASVSAPDLLTGFAAELGVPVTRDAAPPTPPPGGGIGLASAGGAATKLLVLVADDDAAANAAARRLRAAGYHRFTILIGGTEIIRHEGRMGTGRLGGDLPIISGQP